jgi:hypothetical protein
MTKILIYLHRRNYLHRWGPAGEEGGSKPPPPWIFKKKSELRKREIY